MKRIPIALSLLLVLALLFSACSKEPEKARREAQFLVLFDTATTVIGYTETEQEFEDMVNLLYDELEVYHELYDIYNDYEGVANVKTINDSAGIAPVAVDQKLIDLLLFSREAYELSHGTVNVAFGSVLKIWHDYREAGTDDPANARVPDMAELEAAALHTSFDDVIIDEAASTVFLKDPDLRLDVGGIAKGYAVERVVQTLIEAGYTDFLMSAGGNVRAVGWKGDGKTPWKIGIQNPDTASEEQELFTVQLTDVSLVTSGDYIRYYTVEGKRYHHIIDPSTLFPADHFAAVTIVTEDSGLADALSTAVYNMPQEEGAALIESLEDTEALWIYHDGTQVKSSGFDTKTGAR